MAEGARLEIVCGVKPAEGSNPSLSAIIRPPIVVNSTIGGLFITVRFIGSVY